MIDVATLWIISPDGRLLLAQRAYAKPNDPGVWGPTVTGRMDPGEDIATTLTREVQEEIGLTTADFQPIFVHKELFTDHPDGQPRTFWIYYAVLPETITDELQLDPAEVEAVAWHTWAEIKQIMQNNPDTLVFSTSIWPRTIALLQQTGVVPTP